MIHNCKKNLLEIKNLIAVLSADQYQKELSVLSGASIGQHVRHIVEFYLCLLNGVHEGRVCYDKRERDLRLETDCQFVISTVDAIFYQLPNLAIDAPLVLEADFSNEGNALAQITTSYLRELAYCLEHSIHHQALIKVGLLAQELEHLINDDFGVAYATIRYRISCAQ